MENPFLDDVSWFKVTSSCSFPGGLENNRATEVQEVCNRTLREYSFIVFGNILACS